VIWSIYSGSIGILFLVVKVVNCRFHYLFDTTEPTEEPVPEETEEPSPSKRETNGESKPKRDRPKNLGFTET
jgi:hypothetical protein